jgi:hypothetical protein
MTVSQELAWLFGVLFGLYLFASARKQADAAARWAQRLIGRQLDHRIYLLAYKCGGLLMAAISLLALFRVIPSGGK